MGVTRERLSSTSGPTLADLVSAATQRDDHEVDIDELNDDLSFLPIDKAKIGSDTLQRIQNLQAPGGVRMYAEVYELFTETSGRGMSQEVQKLMKPNQAAKEDNIAEENETWEKHMNLLARQRKEYELNQYSSRKL